MNVAPKITGKACVDCKWIFSIKDGNFEKEPLRFKARLKVKGFTQNQDIDYNEIFSLVVKYTAVRIMLTLVPHYDIELE